MFYYLLAAVALRWLLLDYYIFKNFIIPYIRKKFNNKVWHKFLDCPYCNGCQVGYYFYLIVIFNWSLLGGNWSTYFQECINMFIFGITVGYLSLFSKILLDKILDNWEKEQ